MVGVGTNPVGVLPVATNVIYLTRAHADYDPVTASNSCMLLPAQQVNYRRLNMLMAGSGTGEINIYADYNDGQILLWSGTVPTMEDAATFTNPDLRVAYTMTGCWTEGGGPAYNYLVSAGRVLYAFTSGLPLDPKRVLCGVTWHFTPQQYNHCTLLVVAVSAVAVQPEGSIFKIR